MPHHLIVTDQAGPLRDGGPFAIIFSLVCIVVAALMFVVTFNQIGEGVVAGLPRKYGWLGAFGILVELVWLCLEIVNPPLEHGPPRTPPQSEHTNGKDRPGNGR